MAQTQVYSPEAVENFATAFPRRNENSFAWGNAISYYLGLPQLRGFWPMSSVNESGNPYDLSGQGRILTNTNTATFGVYGLQSYTAFNGANYHSRASEAGLSITGDLTIGAWVWQDAIGVADYHITKRNLGAANTNYILQSNAANVISLYIGSGAAYYMATTTQTIAARKWYFVAGRFTPSTSVSVWLNGSRIDNVAAIPAASNAVAFPFQINGFNGANGLTTGYKTLAFICAASCSNAQVNAIFSLTRPLFYGT